LLEELLKELDEIAAKLHDKYEATTSWETLDKLEQGIILAGEQFSRDITELTLKYRNECICEDSGSCQCEEEIK